MCSDAGLVRAVAAISCWVVLAAAGPGIASGQPHLAGADGATLYRTACASCHGADGKGAPKHQVGFDVALPDFTDCSFASREPAADWFTIVHEGGPRRGFSRRMPAFGSVLSPLEIERVVAHVQGLCLDQAWPRGELNLPRAIYTEKAFPEDESVISGAVNGQGAGALRFDYVHEKRFGARNQVEIRVPLMFRQRATARREWTGGDLGDVSLGVKRAIHHTRSATAGSILSVGAEVNLPTGSASRGFGSGTVTFEPFVLAGRMLGPAAFVQAHGGVEFATDRGRATPEAFVRGALGRTFVADGFGRSWTPMVEALVAREMESGAPGEFDVVPQMQVSLNRRQHILVSAGVRLPLTQRSSRARQFVFYVLWDWFDGGLRDGW